VLSHHGGGRGARGMGPVLFVSQVDNVRLGGKLSPFPAVCIFM